MAETRVAAILAARRGTSHGEFTFDTVSGISHGHASHGDHAARAATCGMSFDAFRMAVSRWRGSGVFGSWENPI